MDTSAPQRLNQLANCFPALRHFLNAETLIVSAYPAGLGLTGFALFVDTYLHPPTFMRSLRLAALENRPVLFASQPLVGAELLLSHCALNLELPKRLLWASGGYFMPKSLEEYVRRVMAARGCELEILHCYGVAEIGHTCFAAMSRFECGSPRYKQVAAEVTASINGTSAELYLASTDRKISTGDFAESVDGTWRIRSSERRLHPQILAELESWTADCWKRRTGYMKATRKRLFFQLRQDVRQEESEHELCFHDFWKEFGGSFTCKPNWDATLTDF